MEPRIDFLSVPDLANVILPNQEELERRLRMHAFAGELDTVRVGDVIIKPWELFSLELASPDPSVFRVPEVRDPAERQALAEEAVVAAQDILWVYHELYRQPGIFRRRLAGLCAEGSALAQELLARAGVRTFMVFGQYQAKKTDLFFSASEAWKDPGREPPSRANREGLFSHWWLYECLEGVIPPSLTDAEDQLLIVDPTRWTVR